MKTQLVQFLKDIEPRVFLSWQLAVIITTTTLHFVNWPLSNILIGTGFLELVGLYLSREATLSLRRQAKEREEYGTL